VGAVLARAGSPTVLIARVDTPRSWPPRASRCEPPTNFPHASHHGTPARRYPVDRSRRAGIRHQNQQLDAALQEWVDQRSMVPTAPTTPSGPPVSGCRQ